MAINKVHTKTVEEVVELLDDMKLQLEKGCLVDGMIEILSIDDCCVECRIKHVVTVKIGGNSSVPMATMCMG